MTNTKKRYDNKHKVTRIFLNDYLVLKRISQVAGVSMAEALHKLIEHQAQLPMLDMVAKPIPVTSARSIPVTAVRSTPITVSFSREVTTNGHKQSSR